MKLLDKEEGASRGFLAATIGRGAQSRGSAGRQYELTGGAWCANGPADLALDRCILASDRPALASDRPSGGGA